MSGRNCILGPQTICYPKAPEADRMHKKRDSMGRWQWRNLHNQNCHYAFPHSSTITHVHRLRSFIKSNACGQTAARETERDTGHSLCGWNFWWLACRVLLLLSLLWSHLLSLVKLRQLSYQYGAFGLVIPKTQTQTAWFWEKLIRTTPAVVETIGHGGCCAPLSRYEFSRFTQCLRRVKWYPVRKHGKKYQDCDTELRYPVVWRLWEKAGALWAHEMLASCILGWPLRMFGRGTALFERHASQKNIFAEH
jgi:hypothetical protein